LLNKNFENLTHSPSRLVYTIDHDDAGMQRRRVITEIPYANADMSQCIDGERYPDPDARMR
jgi:hypothetical protein